MSAEIKNLASEIRENAAWTRILIARKNAGALPILAPRDLGPLLAAVQGNFRRGEADTALATCRVLAFVDASLFIRETRRCGLFRSSKVSYQCEPIVLVVKKLIADGEVLGWSSADADYLQSVENLLSVAAGARATRQYLVDEISKRRRTILKSCMVVMDRAFRPAADDQPDEEQHMAEATGLPSHFNREQKASAFSAIVVLMRETCGIDAHATIAIDETGIRDGTYESLMIDAGRLGEFREAEVMLDAYPFRVYISEEQSRTVVLSPIDDQLGKSIQLGFVNASMQARIFSRRAHPDHGSYVSLDDIALDLSRQVGNILVRRERQPVDRYVMAMPSLPEIVKILNRDGVYREEAYYLGHIAREAFAKDFSITDFPLVDGVTVMGMRKVQRFFHLVATVLFQALDQPVTDGDRDELDMRSRIPVFPQTLLLNFLGAIYGEQLARRALEIMSYDVNDDTSHYDIQYRPILRIGAWCMVPLSVLASSDLVRNVLCHNNARLLPADGHDPMVRELEAALTARGFLVKAEVKSSKRPIDLLAYIDGHLFILEAKNAFHPCSAQEMRTSYGHILKGGMQLSEQAQWLASPQIQAHVFKNLGWNVPPAQHIHTGIVTANRIFSGYAIDGHPVRQAHEILNVLGRGIVNLGGDRYRIWRKGTFSVQDFVDYLDGTRIVQDLFDAMPAILPGFPFRDGGCLVFRTFALDLETLSQRLAERYARVDEGEEEEEGAPAGQGDESGG